MNTRDLGVLRQSIGSRQTGGFVSSQNKTKNGLSTHSGMWTPAQQNTQDRSGPLTSSSSHNYIQPVPMEQCEIDSDTDQDPSFLEVPAIN